MDMQRVDTQRAYQLIWQKITTLALAPGSLINEQRLAAELNMALAPVQDALRLLEHDHLVRITPRHGTYVAGVNLADLEQISELRCAVECLAAALAAQRATSDDLAVLDALRQEQMAADPNDARRLFDIDHKFHQAIAAAAHNHYLAETLAHFFGLSLRFWYLGLPEGQGLGLPKGQGLGLPEGQGLGLPEGQGLGLPEGQGLGLPEGQGQAMGVPGAEGAAAGLASLPGAVHKHIALVDAIRAHDATTAEEIMRTHVQSFYEDVRKLLAARA